MLRGFGVKLDFQLQAETLHDMSLSCGAVVRWSYTGPVGLQSPPPLPEHTLTVYVSGVTRRNSGGDCLPVLSLW